MSRGQLSKELIDVGAQRQRLSVEEFAALRASIIEAARPAFSARCPFVPHEVFVKNLGVDDDSFVVRRIEIYRSSATGEAVGYAVIRAAELEIAGSPYVVADGSSYLLDEYRGHGVISIFFYRELVALWLRNLLRRRMFLFVVCSPAAYKVISKYTHEFYPRARTASSPAMQAVFEALKARLGYVTLPSRPFVVMNEMWRRSEDPMERERWRRDPSPDIQFYWEQCGDSGAQGSALVTMIPGHLRNAVLTAGTLFVGKIGDRIRRLWRGSAGRKSAARR